MSKNVTLAVALPAQPDRLFDMYLDPEQHAAITGAPVAIGPQPGTPFSAFHGVLTGRMLHSEPKRLIVQTWRSGRWPKTAIDSVLILSFWPQETGARIELAHVNVPDEDFAGVSEGWEKYYWAPWRAYLAREPVR